MKWTNCVLLLTVVLSSGVAFAANHTLPEKAEKYYQMLLKRPQYGVIFDRFVDAWLEEKSLDDLGNYLTDRSKTAEANAGDWLILALVKVRLGQEKEALEAFDEGLKREPDNVALWLERAKLEARTLAFDPALQSLAKASANPDISDKTKLDVEKLKGRLLLRTGKQQEALNVWKGLIETHSDDEDLAEELVEMQLDEGLHDEASAQMQSLIGRTRDVYAKVNRQLRLGEIFLLAGKKDEALKQFGGALEAAGQSTWIESELLARIEQVFRREDNLTGLATHLEDMAKAHPQRAAISRQLANVYIETDKQKEAEAIYKALLEKSPGQRELREGYLSFLERTKAYPAAIEQTKLLLDQNKGDGELLIRLANLHSLAGDAAAAKVELDRYLAANATEFDHLRVARIYEQAEKKDDALAAYQKIVQIFPESVSAQDAYAQYLHRIDKKDEALAIWNKLAESGDRDQLLAVAQTLIARSENEAAFGLLEKKVEEYQDDSRVLTALNSAAVALKQFKKAQPWAMKRIALASDPEALDNALRQGMQVLSGAESTDEIRTELSKKEALTLQERALLAVLLEEKKDSLGAEDILRKAPEADQLAAQARLVRLVEARRDWMRAAEEMEKLVALDGGKTAANLQRLVQLRTSAGNPEAALELIGEWKTLLPNAPQPWLEEANLLALVSKPKEQIKALEAASRRFDDDVSFIAALGDAHAANGNYAETERLYLGLFEKAEDITEKLRWITALAKTAYSRGELAKLTTTFQERQKLNRQDAAPWLALATIYETSQNQEERLKALQTALAFRENDIPLLHQIATVQEDLGRWKESLATLDRASRVDQTKRSRQMMAMVHFRWGEEEKGQAMMLDALGGDKIPVQDAMRVADMMMAKREWASAAAFLRPVIARYPEDYRLPYLVAVAESEEGRSSEALKLFVQVLHMKSEMPEVTKAKAKSANANTNVASSYQIRMKKIMPPGVMDTQTLIQSAYQVRRYDYDRRNGRPSSNASGVGVPADLEAAHKYAQLQLLYLRETLSAEEQEVLQRELKESAAEYGDLLLSVQHDIFGSNGILLSDEVLQQNIKDVVYCAMWLTSRMSYSNANTANIELCKQVYEQLKEKHIQLALNAAVLAVRSDAAKGAELLNEILDTLLKDDGQNEDGLFFSMSTVASLLGGGQKADPSLIVELPKDTAARVRQFLLKLAMSNYKEEPYVGAIESNIIYGINGFKATNSWDDYVALWDEWLERQKAREKKNVKPARIWSLYLQGARMDAPFIKPIPFPSMGGSLPGLFVVMMHRADPWNPHIEGPLSGPEPTLQPLGAYLDKVKDPDLKLILAHKADKQDLVTQMLDERMKQIAPTMDDYLLAVGFAGYQNDYARAIELIAKALNFPMEGDRRSELDAALVHAVTNLDAEKRKALAADLHKEAQQAIRRLRSTKLPIEHSLELTTAMRTLGMAEEAEQWEKQTARMASISPSSSRRSSSSYSRTQSISKLDKLLAAGNEDGAIRAALQDVKSLHQQNWNGNRDYSIRQAKELMKKLTFKDAKERLMSLIQPAPGAGEQKLLESGIFLTMIGEEKSAIQVFEEVLKRNPKNDVAILELLMTEATSDTDKALERLNKLSWKELASTQIGSSIVIKIRRGDGMPFKARMAIAEAMANFMEASCRVDTPPPPGAFTWLYDLPQAVATYDNQVRLPMMYAGPHSNQGSYNSSPPKTDVERRFFVHEKVCLAMLLDSKVASEGFRSLAGIAIKDGREVDSLVPVARKVLEKMAKDKAGGNWFKAMPQQTYWLEDRSREIWRPEPAEFLIWQAWKSGKSEQIEAEILPLAEKAVPTAQLKWLQLYAQLWTCSESDFGSAATAVLKLPTRNNAVGRPQAEMASFMDVVECWQRRQLSAEHLDGHVVAEVKKNPRSYNQPTWMIAYLEGRKADVKETYEFSLKLMEAMLGPEQTWKQRMTGYTNARYGSGSSFNDASAYRAGEFVNGLSQSSNVATGVLLAEKSGLMEHENWRQNFLRSAADKIGSDANACMDLLKSLPLFGEVDQFTTWGAQKRSGNNSGLMTIVNAIGNKAAVRDAVVKSIQELPNPTFGSDVVLAMLQKDTSAALTQALVKRSAELATLPPVRHAEMAELIKKTIKGDIDPQLHDALKVIMAGDLKMMTNRADVLLKASKVDDLGWTDDEFEQSVPKLVGEVLKMNPEKARNVFIKASELMERKAAQSGWEGDTWTMGWTLRSELLDDFNDQTPGLGAMALAMKLCEEDQSGNLILDGNSEQGLWGNSLFDYWRYRGGMGNPGDAMEKLCKEIATQLGVTRPTLLALGAYQFFNKLAPVSRVDVLQWANEKAAEDPIAKEFAMAGRVFFESHLQTHENVKLHAHLEMIGGVDAAWKHYREAVANEAINPRVRIALASHLCRRVRYDVDGDMVRKAASLCREAHQALHATSGQFHYAPIIQCYGRLPVDDAWKAEAKLHWDAWLARNARNGEDRKHNRAYQPEDEAACAILTIVAGLGNKEWIDKVLRDSHSALSNDPSAFITLVSMGQYAEAEVWLNRSWESQVYHAYTTMQFHPSLESKMQEYVKHCTNKDLAVLGQALLASLNDPPSWVKKEGFKGRNQRALETAERLKQTTFANEAIRTRCLERLANIEATTDALHKEYTEVLNGLDYEKVCAQENTWLIWWRLRPASAALAWHSVRGDNDAIKQLWQRFEKVIGESPEYYQRYAAGYVTSESFWTPVNAWERGVKGDLKKFAELMKFLQQEMPRSDSESSNSESDWRLHFALTAQLIIHAAEGDTKAMEEAVKRHSEHDKSMFKNMMRRNNAFTETLARFVGKSKPHISLEDRLKLIKTLFSNEFVASLYSGTDGNTTKLMGLLSGPGKAFSEEEAGDLIKVLDEVHPRDGRSAQEAVEVLMGIGEWDNAAAICDSQIKLIKELNSKKAEWILNQAQCLERMDKKADARKLVEPLPVATLSDNLKKLQAAMLDRL